MSVVDDSFDQPLKLEEDASAPLAGGIVNHGFQCGLLWGAALAAGARAHQLHGPGSTAEAGAMTAAKGLVDSFEARHQHINCSDITAMNFRGDNPALPILKFMARGGPVGCFRLTAGYAPVAYEEIDEALNGQQLETPLADGPVSCAALLARKMGASQLQATMAAGFAGGIGLSGGACGALAAAIWLITLSGREEGRVKLDYETPGALAAIDRFVEASDYDFECEAIVGRKFQSIDDHAAYVRAEGCSAIIEALASV
jgi:hypothetical protein